MYISRNTIFHQSEESLELVLYNFFVACALSGGILLIFFLAMMVIRTGTDGKYPQHFITSPCGSVLYAKRFTILSYVNYLHFFF